MADITPGQTHALLEKLAEYVMNEVPKKSEVPLKRDMDSRFEKINTRLGQIENRLEKIELEKADKKDVQTILDVLDKSAKQLDIIRTEQVAFNHAFRRLEKRVDELEK